MTAMQLLSSEQVISDTRSALGLGAPSDGNFVDDALLAQLLRGAAWSSCPCLPFILVREVESGLRGLVNDSNGLRERLLQVLETMMTTGDLLEPGLVTHSMQLSKGTLFAAPLSFAMLSEDVAQIFGVSSENELENKPALRGRVVYEGASRRVYGHSSEPLRERLRHAGLRELSMQAWLKEPGTEAAGDFLDRAKEGLKRSDPADVAIDGLEVFDSTRGGIYASCWGGAEGRNGLFVARRPKAYGSAHWMFVEIAHGRLARTAHLPPAGSSHRACDEAWRAQLALDAVNGRPQRYRLRKDARAAYVDMLFPVPLWAHRHLLVMGRQVSSHRSICSYEIPGNLLGEVHAFLEQKLWMKATKD